MLNADTFVYQVQMCDNRILLDNHIRMVGALQKETTNSFAIKLQASWMVGVYEREINDRGLIAA